MTKSFFKDKILVTGAAGQLGHEMQLRLGERCIVKPKEALDVTDEVHLRNWLPVLRPDMIINCAAYSGIIANEDKPQHGWAVNTKAVHVLAEVARQIKTPLLHISTDMVFGMDQRYGATATPYVESDPVGPINNFGVTKAAAEHAIQRANPDGRGYWIVRTANLYERPWRSYSNHAYRLLQLTGRHVPVAALSDGLSSTTYVPHLADALMWIIENRKDFPYGTYHVANSGHASLFEWSHEICSGIPKAPKLAAVGVDEYSRSIGLNKGKLPTFTALDTTKFDDIIGKKRPSWQEAVEEYQTAWKRMVA